MSKKDVYNTIVVASEPRGRFENCYISGTPKPGTVMNKTTAEPKFGRFTYAGGWDGSAKPGAICVLVEDNLQGKTIDDAYVDGAMGLLYFPLPGEELLCLVADVGGTGDAYAINDMLSPDPSTGKLADSVGTAGPRPFECLETLTALAADTLVHVAFTGY